MQELVEEKMKDIVVERKKGKWEYSGSYDVEGMLYCSCCKHEIDVSEGYFKYCPNCGSFMMKEN
jgi:Zn finger protein HypA/HybF involved in hydrogenase expression